MEDVIQFIQAVCLAIVGVKLIQRLKEYFPDFYDDNRKKLIISVFGMTFPLSIKAIHNFSRSVYSPYNEFVVKYYSEEHFIYNVICEIIPVFFQLSTLIFGFIRK